MSGSGNLEDGAETIIEFLRNVAGDFEMLLLVLAHGNEVRIVEQDISGHEDRISEKAVVARVGALRNLAPCSYMRPLEAAPSGVTTESSQASSCTWGTSLWRKRIVRVGSSPQARNPAATSKV